MPSCESELHTFIHMNPLSRNPGSAPVNNILFTSDFTLTKMKLGNLAGCCSGYFITLAQFCKYQRNSLNDLLFQPTKENICLLRVICMTRVERTVKPVLSSYSKIDKTKVLKTNGSLMKVKSIAECSLGGFCNTFDLH